MGYVDRFDKNCALFRLRFKRCIKRFHRAIFMWYVGLILNNIIVLFDLLFATADELRKSKEASGLGYKHWFENEMGNVLIEDGMRLAKLRRRTRAAVMITAFSRIVLSKLRVGSLRAAAATVRQCQLQTIRHRPVARCQLQNLRPRNARPGRPVKRKRGGGGPRKKVCVC